MQPPLSPSPNLSLTRTRTRTLTHSAHLTQPTHRYPDSSVTEVGAKELSKLRADDEDRAAQHSGGMHQPVGP